MIVKCAAAAAALAIAASTARAQLPCPGNADALGTVRVLRVDAATPPRLGRKQFPQTLPLAPREVVLTFDDGPRDVTTARVLDALAHECVHASFFLIGRNTLAQAALARRILNEGHTVAHHSFSHPLLARIAPSAAKADIDRGFATVDEALYGRAEHAPTTGIRSRRSRSLRSHLAALRPIRAELCFCTIPRHARPPCFPTFCARSRFAAIALCMSSRRRRM